MGKITLSLPGANLSAVSGVQKIVASASPAALKLSIFVDGVERATASNSGLLQYLWDTTGYANSSPHLIRADAVSKARTDSSSLNVTVNNSGGGGGAGATLTMTFGGKIRDKVAQGEAVSSDSLLDGVFTATLSGAARTVTSLRLDRLDANGFPAFSWNTTYGDGFWVLGANKNLDGALLNNPDQTVNFPLAVGESFYLYASDYQDAQFTAGQTYRLTATFSDGSSAIANATVSTPTGNPSGIPMPTGDLPGWRWIFGDDFNTPVPLGQFPAAVSSKWYAYPQGWHDTSGNGSYWPEKGLSVHDGELDMWIHTETINGVATHIVEAPVPKVLGDVNKPDGFPAADQLYGRYAVCFHMDAIVGYKTAWLLWPQSNIHPRDGEIDFPEGDLTSTIGAFMHRQNGTSGSDQDAYATNVPEAGAWHTAVIEWLPTRCTFILDGVVIGQSTARIPSTPMHWVLQTETMLSGGAPADSAQGHVLVDWVVVYAKV